MSISEFINRNLSSFSRSKRKKQVINTVFNSQQENTGVINIHRVDHNNAGDFFCAPHQYFEVLKGKELDIYDFKHKDKSVTNNWSSKIINNSLIIGGGGLLNRNSFEKQMKLFEALNKKGKKTVLWGIGHNEKKQSSFSNVSNYNIDTNNFGLVGTRDFSMKTDWVPCVSCLHDIFNESDNEEHEIGLIYHKKTLKKKSLIKKLENYPSTSNTADIENIVSFIKKSNTIVTDSYHAMYWSMLLNKRVVVIPNSSKFFDFKYQPIFASFDDFETKLKESVSYSGVLEECRDINLQFSEKAFNYLNL